MSRSLRLAGGLLLASCASSPASHVVPETALAWTDVRTVDGAPTGLRTAAVWGSARGGAYGALTALPPGLTEPVHRHSHVFRALVVAGTMRYAFGGWSSPELRAGSYITIAPGCPHFATCSSSTPCEVYIEQDGAFDVIAGSGSSHCAEPTVSTSMSGGP